MTIPIIIIVGYLIGLPIILRIIAQMQKKLVVDRAIEKAGKTSSAATLRNLPKPAWGVWKERMGFTMKDKRPVMFRKKPVGLQNRLMMLILWLAGLAVSALGAFISIWPLVAVGYLLFFVMVIFAVKASKSVLETQKKVMKRMFEIGVSKGLISSEYVDNPGAVIKVLEWKDYVKPQKVEYQVKTEFSDTGEEAFMKQFNQIFGLETAWVPTDDPESGAPGWNYEEGKVTINAVPPLPQKADWDEHYVLADGVAWSFFPLALAVENGLELPNPKTGEIENVLGFDLSGEQGKVAKKAGYKLAPKIVTSPMVLAGGGTGGGKSLWVDTPVRVLNTSERPNKS